MSWEIILLYFFSWKVIWFFKKEPIKGQNFRLSTAQVRFRLICTLIGLFCWKFIKFQLKMYEEVMSHDMEKWCKIWRKADLLFQKWQDFGESWSEHPKVSKICTLIGPFYAKYITLDLKNYRGVIFHDTEESCKVCTKTDLWFGKLYEKFDKSLPEHLKVSKLGLWWHPFVQSKKCMSLNFTGMLCVITMTNYAKFEKELTCQF